MRLTSTSILFVTLLAACSAAPRQANTAQYASMSTAALWAQQQIVSTPLNLAFIEAELATRGQTRSGTAYLGQRTSAAFGRQIYARDTSLAGERDCDDFPSTAAAQRFFLDSGGPVSDPHNLDSDGDGLACEWGTQIRRIARAGPAPTLYIPRRTASSRCYTGPRGGTYTLTASGNRNYSGC